ncbi:Acetylornithine aminotransferase [uncultured delta proteobacterium]|uniref:Acetylornithine aminotransferase n=1 Tax=uncultured delta proteobacterium TaxID=34034 RepID=A0A212K3W1_9DELT|nr:Acetylornithine aminotransferase [uncultured delta proteobacterium]
MSRFDEIKQREESLLCRTYGRYPIAVQSGKGSRLWDFDGKEYVDLLAGIAVTSLGHCNEELALVMEKQARKLVHVSNLFYQEEQLDLAKRLLATAHCGKAFFCNSGAEANEAAIKLARRYNQRVKENGAFEIISFTGAFHGRTMATVAATGQAKFQDGFAPIPTGFTQVPMGDIAALKAAVTEKTAAVIMEMVQGEGGVNPVDPDFLLAAYALCREKGVLFIADEVQAGLCRTGKWWAFQHFGIEPDIVSTAKALANGLPMGAIMATDEVAKGFVAGSHATTFGAGALVSAVASKTLEIMERDNLAARAGELGDWAMNRFREVGKKIPGAIDEVRGKGLFIGIVLAKPGKAVWDALLDKGFICNLTQERVLRLLPALTVEKADLEAFAQALEGILKK